MRSPSARSAAYSGSRNGIGYSSYDSCSYQEKPKRRLARAYPSCVETAFLGVRWGARASCQTALRSGATSPLCFSLVLLILCYSDLAVWNVHGDVTIRATTQNARVPSLVPFFPISIIICAFHFVLLLCLLRFPFPRTFDSTSHQLLVCPTTASLHAAFSYPANGLLL